MSTELKHMKKKYSKPMAVSMKDPDFNFIKVIIELGPDIRNASEAIRYAIIKTAAILLNEQRRKP